jgi:hypothetical protein
MHVASQLQIESPYALITQKSYFQQVFMFAYIKSGVNHHIRTN